MKVFVTGTDTGVGKTTVCVALAARCRALGLSVFAFKPIETGGTEDQQALGHGLYTFKQPAAPWVAAQAEGKSIELATVVDTVSRETSQVVIVEGAGGWRVPITETEDMSSLAAQLGYPVLVVARAALGTINHSLLTIEAVERDGLAIAALVLSHRPDDDLSFTHSNADQIRQRWGGEILIYVGDGSVFDALISSMIARDLPRTE
nr:dethiobiotin synthase [Kofleriaceae bacterium]